MKVISDSRISPYMFIKGKWMFVEFRGYEWIEGKEEEGYAVFEVTRWNGDLEKRAVKIPLREIYERD